MNIRLILPHNDDVFIFLHPYIYEFQQAVMSTPLSCTVMAQPEGKLPSV